MNKIFIYKPRNLSRDAPGIGLGMSEINRTLQPQGDIRMNAIYINIMYARKYPTKNMYYAHR